MSKQLLKILLLIITATPLSAMAESVLSKDQIMEYIHTMPYDFEQISKDSKAYDELLFRERERRLQFVEIEKYPTPTQRKRQTAATRTRSAPSAR